MMSKRICVFLWIASALLLGNGQTKACLKVDSIAAGERHSVLAMEDGSVWACGFNFYGQLGVGYNTLSAPYGVDTLTRVLGGATGTTYLTNIAQIAPGTVHTVARDNEDNVCSWGLNYYSSYSQGMLGNNSTDPCYIPVWVWSGDQDPYNDYLEDIEVIAAGRSGRHTLAVDSGGHVWSWGSNSTLLAQIGGQLGHGPTSQYSQTPIQVYAGQQREINDPCASPDPDAPLSNIIAVAGGMNFSLALDDPCGRVYSFGSNRYEELGINDSNVDYKLTPVAVLTDPCDDESYLEDIAAIAAGAEHSLALDNSGNVWIWGTPAYHSGYVGTLGDGSAAGVASSVAIYVRAGDQNPGDPDVPLSNITAISAGAGHNMALDSNGYVWTWGENSFGQLGVDEDEDYIAKYPVKVHGGQMGTQYLENITAISAGYGFCLALDTDGVVWVWGINENGQLGLDDTTEYYVPQQMLCAGADDFGVTKTSVPEASPLDPCDPCSNGITYTICYWNDSGYDACNVVMVDYLPEGVTLINPDPCSDPCYSAAEHSYRWYLGTLADDACDCKTLTVEVNGKAPPAEEIKNTVVIQNGYYIGSDTATNETTCWCDGDIIVYVDRDAWGGNNDGGSWANAYRDLHDGIDRMDGGCGDEIWIAEGTYYPGDADHESLSFELTGDAELYGGFVGDETERAQRSPIGHPVILSGDYGDGDLANNVVTMTDSGGNVVLDGVVVTGGETGVDISDGDARIARCDIRENDDDGIYYGSSCTPVIVNSWIRNNGQYGIWGNYISSGSPVISNNTIVYNEVYGIRYSSYVSDLPISNCIVLVEWP